MYNRIVERPVFQQNKGRTVMSKYVWRCVPACIGAALLMGCASSVKQLEEEALLPEIDIVQLKENSDEALKLAQEAKLEVQVVNTKLAEIDNRLVVLSEEVSSVSLAKIEEIENRLALLIEAYKDLHEQIAALEALPSVKKKGGSAAPTFSPSAAGKIVTSSEYEAYQNALRAFNSRTYDKAHKLFTELLEKYPSGTYASNAQYWIGECHYAQAKYADAIASFDKVLSYAKSPKADDAQLKIGLSYLKMGKKTHAKESFNLLVNRFPHSEYVPRAKKYLAELN
ncbi:MAG: tol-pal system protein YbgF [Chitinivibrionales bacterium]|nr:tol-pal system protein YbgF [Chitinivibrionales bacterium]